MSINLPRLRRLDLTNNPEMNLGCLSFGRLPNLKYLYLSTHHKHSENVKLTDWTTSTITNRLRHLTSLSISKLELNTGFDSNPFGYDSVMY